MYTHHGHHIPFTSLTDDRPEAVKDCGGVRICPGCTVEAMPHMPAFRSLQHISIFQGTQGRVMNFQDKAKKIVFDYVKHRLEKTDTHVTFAPDEVYIVWFSKTLQNWKALVSTTLPDGMYYEVTYNGDKRETYLDAYKKFDNVKIRDEAVDNFAESVLN